MSRLSSSEKFLNNFATIYYDLCGFWRKQNIWWMMLGSTFRKIFWVIFLGFFFEIELGLYSSFPLLFFLFFFCIFECLYSFSSSSTFTWGSGSSILTPLSSWFFWVGRKAFNSCLTEELGNKSGYSSLILSVCLKI